MKKNIWLASLGLALIAGVAHADVNSLCSSISNDSDSYGEACSRATEGKSFNTAALDVCSNIAGDSDSQAILCLRTIADKSFDPQATKICADIAGDSDSSAISCLSAISDKTYTQGQVNQCAEYAQDSDSQGVACLRNSGSAASGGQNSGSNLDTWTYFNGASRTVSNNNGWIQLETEKNYCNGRVRLTKKDPESLADILNPSYLLEVQGSWCQTVKFGYRVSGNNYEQTNATMKFNLDKSNGGNGSWSGYGGNFNIPVSALESMSNGISASQLSMVLYTNSREDTRKQAYEKLTIDLGVSP